MNRNFDAPMLDLDGKPYTDKATLKSVVFGAIQAQLMGDEQMSTDVKLRLYTVASKIAKGGVVEVSVEDLALIKDRVGRAYSPLVVGEAFRLLEQDYVAPAANDGAGQADKAAA
jgi:hypothetical protein